MPALQARSATDGRGTGANGACASGERSSPGGSRRDSSGDPSPPTAQRELEVETLEEVHACFAVTGEADFLQVVAPDLDAYGEFAMQRIRRLPGIKSMQTMFVLRKMKELPVFPVD